MPPATFDSLVRTAAPAVPPLDLGEVKTWLRVDESDTTQDSVLARLIGAAGERYERVSRRALMAQAWRLKLNCFPPMIALPMPPLLAVTSLKYQDYPGALITMGPAEYRVDTDALPALVYPPYGTSWPPCPVQPGAVELTFQCGHQSAANVPEEVKQRLLAHVSYQYHNRETQDEEYLNGLFDSFRWSW